MINKLLNPDVFEYAVVQKSSLQVIMNVSIISYSSMQGLLTYFCRTNQSLSSTDSLHDDDSSVASFQHHIHYWPAVLQTPRNSLKSRKCTVFFKMSIGNVFKFCVLSCCILCDLNTYYVFLPFFASLENVCQ